jgi:hypothetical protein
MESLRFLPPTMRALDEARAELCAFSVFADERPFKRVAGLLDWRLAGKLSALARDGFVSGAADEVVMLAGPPRLPFDKLLIFGLGSRQAFGDDGFRAWLSRLRGALGGLHVRRAVVELAGRAILPPARRADLLVEATLGAEAIDRFVFVEDDEGQRAISNRWMRPDLRVRTG